MEISELHNVMMELVPSIVAMARTGGADIADLGGIVAAMLAGIAIEAGIDNDVDRFKFLEAILDTAKFQLTMR